MTKEDFDAEVYEYAKSRIGTEDSRMTDRMLAYRAGAEPREKRIEELIALINAERERQEKCDDVHLRKIADLEKENAELSMKRKAERKIFQGIVEKKNDQLTKAKEILQEFVEWANWQGNSKCPSFKSIQNKAEQFISEVEK